MNDRYAHLRAALNLDLPPLPWHAPGLAELHDADDVCVAYFSDCEPVEQERRPVPSINEGDRFALYVVAANPETIRSLLADYDRMRDALEKVRPVIAADRQSLLETHGDGIEIPAADELGALGLYEYDGALHVIDAALAQEQGESDD